MGFEARNGPKAPSGAAVERQRDAKHRSSGAARVLAER